MNGKRRMYDDMGEIKKGPWKEEEDKVLLNHVKKYGPRDWSSIRSKGLLQRTGKSCRLRWVNKLRPNLKTGMKFSAEEEETVINLQAQFGNKWAKIATYLPGRTDNDVKNFWSSRRKRLARSAQTTPSSSHKHVDASSSSEGLIIHSEDLLQREDVYKRDIKPEEEEKGLNDLIYPPSFDFQDRSQYQLDFDPFDTKMYYNALQSSLPFPPQLNLDFPPLESQELISTDPYFFDVFGSASCSLDIHLPTVSSWCYEPERSPDISFMDDFPPLDIFDHINPLQSPSQ